MTDNYEDDVTERLRVALNELIPPHLIMQRLKEGLSANRLRHQMVRGRLIEVETPDYRVRQQYLRLIRQTGLYQPTEAEIEATRPPQSARGKHARSVKKSRQPGGF
jgi:hypothetical protein